MTEQNPFESKQRIIQEFVPGKQVTMAHLIANPNEDLYKIKPLHSWGGYKAR